MTGMTYGEWIKQSQPGKEELAAMEQQVDGFGYKPGISLLMTVSDPDEIWIKTTLDSVLGQVYPQLELCICDNGSERPHVSEALEEYANDDDRVKLCRMAEKKSRVEAWNEALSTASGEFVALLDQGDELAPDALFKVIELLQSDRAGVIYTDEDRIDVSGVRSHPIFKPYWSPDLLLSTGYIGRLCLMRRCLVEGVGGFRRGFEGVEEHDLRLRVSEKTGRVRHLPEVLYHRRWLPGHDEASGDDSRASVRAIEDALARREADAAVEPGLVEGTVRVVRRFEKQPRASVIVFNTEGTDEVPLVEELKRQTSYPVHEVIVAGVGREDPSPHRVNHPFPARALNTAAGEAGGGILVFLDGRAQITDPDWLTEMVSQVRRPEAGAVGCKVVNPSGGLRHGGSHVEMNRLTGASEDPVGEAGNLLPLVNHPFNFSAASAECMAIRRTLFERVGGFDDEHLPTAFYDLDLSFRLRERGLLNVYTPHATMVCRGNRPLPGEDEVEYMWERWWEKLVQALYYQRSPLHAAPHAPEREVLAAIPS